MSANRRLTRAAEAAAARARKQRRPKNRTLRRSDATPAPVRGGPQVTGWAAERGTRDLRIVPEPKPVVDPNFNALVAAAGPVALKRATPLDPAAGLEGGVVFLLCEPVAAFLARYRKLGGSYEVSEFDGRTVWLTGRMAVLEAGGLTALVSSRELPAAAAWVAHLEASGQIPGGPEKQPA
jgi:hypothetical protein